MNTVTIKPACLDLSDAAVYVALSETTVQKLIREDAFPKAKQMSGRRVAWLVRELDAWVDTRPIANQLPPPNTSRRMPRPSTPAAQGGLTAA